MKDAHDGARAPVWRAVKLAHAALDDPATCPRDRAVAQAIIGAAEVAALPWIEDAALDLAEAVIDRGVDLDLRRSAWRTLSEEARAQKPMGRRFGAYVAPLLVVGGTAA